MRPHQWRCISACYEKHRLGITHELCAVCQYDKLLAACTLAFALIDSVEWSRDMARLSVVEMTKAALQAAITAAGE